jgi:clan AA aspartic protease (TIGR02281 family)
MQLTDERQIAINEARARIGEEGWLALWDNQKVWVRSYAAACGVPPDGPPPMQVASAIKACFKRAALARVAFLRSYGMAAGGAAPAPKMPPPARHDDGPDDIIRVPLIASHGNQILIPGAINGKPVVFEVDSGASGIVVPAPIGKKLGLGEPIRIANVMLADGRTEIYPVYNAATLKIGDAVLTGVEIIVTTGGETILLGRAALNRFSDWAIAKNALLLAR